MVTIIPARPEARASPSKHSTRGTDGLEGGEFRPTADGGSQPETAPRTAADGGPDGNRTLRFTHLLCILVLSFTHLLGVLGRENAQTISEPRFGSSIPMRASSWPPSPGLSPGPGADRARPRSRRTCHARMRRRRARRAGCRALGPKHNQSNRRRVALLEAPRAPGKTARPRSCILQTCYSAAWRARSRSKMGPRKRPV